MCGPVHPAPPGFTVAQSQRRFCEKPEGAWRPRGQQGGCCLGTGRLCAGLRATGPGQAPVLWGSKGGGQRGLPAVEPTVKAPAPRGERRSSPGLSVNRSQRSSFIEKCKGSHALKLCPEETHSLELSEGKARPDSSREVMSAPDQPQPRGAQGHTALPSPDFPQQRVEGPEQL